MIKVERLENDRLAFRVDGNPLDLYDECEILVHGLLGNELLRIIFIKRLEEALPELLKEISNDKNNISNKSDQ